MVIFISANGTTRVLQYSTITQGSHKANSITLIAPFASTTAVYVNAILPSGIKVPPIKDAGAGARIAGCGVDLSALEFKDSSGNVLNAWHFDIDAVLTKESGSVSLTFNFVFMDGSKLPVNIALPVNAGNPTYVEGDDIANLAGWVTAATNAKADAEMAQKAAEDARDESGKILDSCVKKDKEGNVIIEGDLIVEGESKFIDLELIRSEQAYLILNSEVTSTPDIGYAGVLMAELTDDCANSFVHGGFGLVYDYKDKRLKAGFFVDEINKDFSNTGKDAWGLKLDFIKAPGFIPIAYPRALSFQIDNGVADYLEKTGTDFEGKPQIVAKILVDSNGNVVVGNAKDLAIILGSSQAVNDYAVAAGVNCIAFEYASFASGYNTFAGGRFSVAQGHTTRAKGAASFAGGYNTEAVGNHSTAFGSGCKAIGENSVAVGINTEAEKHSFASGSGSKATGQMAFATGSATEAQANYSFAEGLKTQATAKGSHAQGAFSKAKHENSFAGGKYTKTSRANQTVFGEFNADDAEALLIIGNGTDDKSSTRSNAFVVKEDGRVQIGANPIDDMDVVPKGYFDEVIGDISTALDELHEYAQLLVSGGNS